MADIINVLPDSVANQIAAGEVVIRPASVVKELVENAVDAGAKHIEVIVKNAGRTLIQVIDDGSGMSETDARIAFERHATSKIKQADDLFHLSTKGFRGEALAAIAAISHVELRTRRAEDELGTEIFMEGSKCIDQHACTCEKGASFSIKNLFFNVPARRNFLKSDNIEFSHIQEEFLRVALIHHNISFSLYHNDKVEYKLPIGTLKQRIVNIFGNSYNDKLIPVEQNITLVNISGFIVKPEFAKKSKGEQYMFANNRYIRHPYLNHAIESAFSELIKDNTHPGYFIYLQVPANALDINISPTKTEAKFQEEKNIYSILYSTIKHSLGKFNLTPSLDFDDAQIGISFNNQHIPQQPLSYKNPDYNPFDKKTFQQHASGSENTWKASGGNQGWEKIYASIKENTPEEAIEDQQSQLRLQEEDTQPVASNNNVFQVLDKYIVGKLKSGLIIIDIDAAMERIMYERFLKQLDQHTDGSCQKMLFGETLTFSPQQAEIVKELLPELHSLGFGIEEFGKNTFIIDGMPAEVSGQHPQEVIDSLLSTYNNNLLSLKISKKSNLAHSFARTVKYRQKPLTDLEMQNIIHELFTTSAPQISPGKKRICVMFDGQELLKIFK